MGVGVVGADLAVNVGERLRWSAVVVCGVVWSIWNGNQRRRHSWCALVVVYPNSARNALWLFSSFLDDRVGKPVGGRWVRSKFGFGIGSFGPERALGQVPVLAEDETQD